MKRQVFTKPGENSLNGYADALCPFRNRQRFAFVREQPIRAHVSRLLLLVCPTAIAWLVVAAIVGIAVQCVEPRRRFTHVLQERLERLDPLIADADAATTVPMIVSAFWISAPLDHTLPDFEFPGFRLPMRCQFALDVFIVETAARPRHVIPEAADKDGAQRSAVAPAVPRDAVTGAAREGEDGPSAKAFACHVGDRSSHCCLNWVIVCSIIVHNKRGENNGI